MLLYYKKIYLYICIVKKVWVIWIGNYVNKNNNMNLILILVKINFFLSVYIKVVIFFSGLCVTILLDLL